MGRRFLLPLIVASAALFAPALAYAEPKIVPLACETTEDTSGPLDLDGALDGWLSFVDAGLTDGQTTYYQITNGTNHGEGIGTFNTGSPNTFTRDVAEHSTDGLGTPLTLSGASTICLGMTSKVLTAGVAFLDVAQVTVDDAAYDASGWNGNETVPTKNAVRDVIEGLSFQPLDSDLTSWAGITRASGFDTFVATPSWSNFLTLVTGEPTFKVPGRQTRFIPAGAMVPRATNGAQQAAYDSGNVDTTIPVLDFDGAADEFAQFQIVLPKGYDGGTISFQPVWTCTGCTAGETVEFELACVFLRNDDALNTATGTRKDSDDVVIAAGDQHTGPEPGTAVTCDGTHADGAYINFQVNRDVSDDDMDEDARLLGVILYYTDDLANDN